MVSAREETAANTRECQSFLPMVFPGERLDEQGEDGLEGGQAKKTDRAARQQGEFGRGPFHWDAAVRRRHGSTWRT